VDEDLVAWMGELGVPLVVVVHVNHAREIDHEVRRALRVMATAGATLLNQTVLLRGVNDSVAALSDLGEKLFDAGVLPYYLHLLDPVEGAAHFEVLLEEARRLHTALRARLPGYLVSRLVREIPGAPAKVAPNLW
jgi:L-lysine 2,3-aminomutase